MVSFESDYIMGAHPDVLKRILETNMEPLSGYGADKYCESAASKIKKACGHDDAEVYFLVGGTQTNQLVISTVLAPYEGVIAANTGHVSIHEAGAIEYTGHKVLTLESRDGKIDADSLERYLEAFYNDGNHEHMVFPGMVYISYPTEYGSLYSKAELTRIHEACGKYDLPLFIDGARLGYGLASTSCDMTMKDIADLSDVFYVGGTKVGALCGEALVFTHHNTPKHFVTQIKQHGALLAKGRLLGVQFDALFTDDLYMKISANAIDKAEKMKKLLREKGYEFYLESPTNQQFIVLENTRMQELMEHVKFSFWEAVDEEHTVVRLATSWATRDEDIEELGRYL